MALGTKDYNAIAAVFASTLRGFHLRRTDDTRPEMIARNIAQCQGVEQSIFDLADWMASQNPYFNKQKFILACGPED